MVPARPAVMRARTLFTSLVGLVLFAGCAAEEEAQRPVKKGTTGTAAPGGDNKNGEHGEAVPAGPSTTPDPGTNLTSETWATGKKIDANVNIPAGETIEIAPGAVVTVATGVAITVKGTLKIASTGAHAKLTGTNWTGIVVAAGGTLDANGLDLENAASALWTQEGNTSAKVTNGVIKAATPFKMEKGSKLAITKTKVTATQGSAIAGSFTASFMEYDKGTAAGLTLNDPAGSMSFSDSILKGAGGGDYVISTAGKLVKVEYTTISGSHCALHFTGVDQYVVDHVSLDLNPYGAMFYGSGAGPNSVTASNLDGIYDMNGTNGPLTIDNSFLTPGATTPGLPEPQNTAAARLANAQPRAQ
jgi:hypothetical protein